MRLENFLALTHGKLINEPCVSSFNNIVFNPSKVKRGDLFFSYDLDDIDLAIQNGAYGIVFDGVVKVSDDEIAWMKVPNIDEAIIRLLRFKMIEKEIVVYECNEIIQKLALGLSTDSNFLVLSGDLQTTFHSLWRLDDRATILFCPELNSSKIFVDIRSLPTTAMQPVEIMEQTLFETSFIYDNIFYERQLISPFFIPYLQELLHLLRTIKVNFKLKKFTPLEHFEAVFTNSNFEVKNFGTSDKVLIFEPNTTLVEGEVKFLLQNAPWANIIFVIPSDMKQDETKNLFNYRDTDELWRILRAKEFNFALIVGVDKSILQNPPKKPTQLLLDI